VVDRQDDSKVYTSFDQVLPSRKDLERLSARQQATEGQEQQQSDAQEQHGSDALEQGDLVVATPLLLLVVLPSYTPLCCTLARCKFDASNRRVQLTCIQAVHRSGASKRVLYATRQRKLLDVRCHAHTQGY